MPPVTSRFEEIEFAEETPVEPVNFQIQRRSRKWQPKSKSEIRIIRSDNAPEFGDADARRIYAEFGISHLKTIPLAHEMNGLVERCILTINKVAQGTFP